MKIFLVFTNFLAIISLFYEVKNVQNMAGKFCQIEKSCEIRGSQIKYFGAVAKEANSSISSQRKTIDAKAADDAAAAAAAPLRGSK